MNRRALLVLLAVAPFAARAQERAQPELPKETLAVVTRDGTRHSFSVEMARTPEQQTVGLMFRESVPADGGMLFDWGSPRPSQMWMRNTASAAGVVRSGMGRSFSTAHTPAQQRPTVYGL